MAITGDPMWVDHAEEMAFNCFAAATSWDMKTLRYHTSPNMPVSDNTLKTPIFDFGDGWNGLSGTWMNPHAHRCRQHNTGMGWPDYVKHLWYATSDNGLATGLYGPGEVTAKVANKKEVKITEKTHYPFRDKITLTVTTSDTVKFPLYLRIPEWCENPEVTVNETDLKTGPKTGNYIRIGRTWHNKDRIVLHLPMELRIKRWSSMGNSVSVLRGPLTYSLKIKPRREKTTTYDWSDQAIDFAEKHNVPVDRFAGTKEWPAYNLYPKNPWNYALVLNKDNPTENFEVKLKEWPVTNTPFKLEDVPFVIKAKGKRIPGWGLEEHHLTEELPQSPVQTNQKSERITLVPMGAARLRISAFPVAK